MPPTFPLGLPTESGLAGDLARQLATLVGPAINGSDGTLAGAEYLALGGALRDARAATLAALAEATPQTATLLLAEWERMLAVPLATGLTTDARRARILARLRARGGSAERVARAATTLAGGDVSVTEYLYSAVTSSPRLVFRVAVTLPVAAYGDPVLRAQAEDLCQRQLPGQVTWSLGTNETFMWDTTGAGWDRAPWAG